MIIFDASGERVARNTSIVAGNADYTVRGWLSATAYTTDPVYQTAFLTVNGLGTYTQWILLYVWQQGGDLEVGVELNNGVLPSANLQWDLGRTMPTGLWVPFAYTRGNGGARHRLYVNRYLVDTSTLDMSGVGFTDVVFGDDGVSSSAGLRLACVEEDDSEQTFAQLWSGWNSLTPSAGAYTYYSFTANATDSSGNARNLTTTGTPTYSANPTAPPAPTPGALVVHTNNNDDPPSLTDQTSIATNLSRTTAAVLQTFFLQPGWTSFNANEHCGVLASGIQAFPGEYTDPALDDVVDALYLYNADFTPIARVTSLVTAPSSGNPSTFNPLWASSTKFYWLQYDGTDNKVYTISSAGVVGGTVYTLPATGFSGSNNRPRCANVSPDESLLYWMVNGATGGTQGNGQPIRVYNLNTQSAAANLVTFTNEKPGMDLMTLPDGDLLMLVRSTTLPVDWHLRRITPAGATVYNVSFGDIQGFSGETNLPRLCLDHFEPTACWIFGHDLTDPTDVRTLLFRVAIADGAALDSFSVPSIDSDSADRTYTPISCPLIVMPSSGGGAYELRTVPIRRLRRAPHLTTEQLWNFFSFLQLDIQAGVGLSTGQGSDPQLMLRWSDDGGFTWSNEHWVSAGKIGQYTRRAIWRRLGRGRDRVFEVSMSDPVFWGIFDAFLQMERGSS